MAANRTYKMELTEREWEVIASALCCVEPIGGGSEIRTLSEKIGRSIPVEPDTKLTQQMHATVLEIEAESHY